MKNTTLLVSILLFAKLSIAQDINSELDYYQSVYGKEKKAVVDHFMGLVAEQAKAFWAVYDKYEAERKEIGKNRIDNLTSYAEQYDGLTDDQADALTKKVLSNRSSQEKLYKKYFGQMKKAIGAKKALQFMQVEVYFQTAIQFAILSSVPFVGEM